MADGKLKKIKVCKGCCKGDLSSKKYPKGRWNLFPLELTGVVEAITNVFLLLRKSSKNLITTTAVKEQKDNIDADLMYVYLVLNSFLKSIFKGFKGFNIFYF